VSIGGVVAGVGSAGRIVLGAASIDAAATGCSRGGGAGVGEEPPRVSANASDAPITPIAPITAIGSQRLGGRSS